jgi:molybdate transport system substrate-binding protein
MINRFVVSLFIVLLAIMMLPRLGRADDADKGADKGLFIYCGITMVRPITEIAHKFEAKEKVKVTISQGGSEDLYQSAKKSRMGDLYLPGEPDYRTKYLKEGLLGDYVTIGYNQLAMMVRKGNPKKVKGDLRELLRNDLLIIIGNAQSGSIGLASKEALEKIGIYTQVLDRAVFLAPDSRSLNIAMKKGEADLILNWRATGFFSDNAPYMDVVDLDRKTAKPQALLLNLLTFSTQKELARRFMDFAASAEGQSIFRKYGFHDNTYLAR